MGKIAPEDFMETRTLKERILTPINREYGTYRGLIRLALADLEHRAGRLGSLAHPNLRKVRRVVFVCQGNICRSPFAHAYAKRLGLDAGSFGLATSADAPAYPMAVETARKFGVDLSAHRTTDLEDFGFEPGDLLLAMEVRQARRIVSLVADKDVQVSLLGLWGTPRRVHIHDPHTLSAEYFETCFERIKSSVEGLHRALGNT